MISIWEENTYYKNRDFVIIGAGFSGLWTALSIKEKYPEKSVLVIEKESVPKGASTKNAGFACFGSLTEILSDAENMGWEKTLDLIQLRYAGLQKILNYVDADAIDYVQCGGYELLKETVSQSTLTLVNQKLSSITGCPETFVLNNEKIKTFGFEQVECLIENPLEGSLHPAKLIQELTERCRSYGVEFLFGTGLQSVDENPDFLKLTLENKSTIPCQHLIFCTNALGMDFMNEDITPSRGQVLLTSEIDHLKISGTFHYDEGFYYFRNLGNRILLGGARNKDFLTEKTTDFQVTKTIQNHLEQFLQEVVLPHQEYSIEKRWSGIMAFGKEKTPIVKKLSDRQYAVVRLSGMGVALAPMLGEKISELFIQ